RIPERREPRLRSPIALRIAHQRADLPHLVRLLRPRGERPAHCTAEKRDELAPPHSITSSARASNVGATDKPSALAVVRLMTRSNLVGCATGRKASPRAESCRHTRLHAGTGLGSLRHKTSNLPLRRTPANHASSAVARRPPRC